MHDVFCPVRERLRSPFFVGSPVWEAVWGTETTGRRAWEALTHLIAADPTGLPIVLSGASMTRKRQENVKSSVKNGKSLPIRPQRCHGKLMKWEGLTGISFRMCIQEWSAKLR